MKVTPTTANASLSNTATVSSSTADPASTNNHSMTTTQVNAASADLVITQTDGPGDCTVGVCFFYLLQVHNNGPDTASSVSASDVLPAGVSFKSATTGCSN